MGWSNIFTGVGQVFRGGADDFRVCLTKYGCETGYKWIFKRNAKDRIECRKHCGWYIHATIGGGLGIFSIKKCCLEHSCGGMGRDVLKPDLTSKLVHMIIVGCVRDKPTIKPKDIADDVYKNYGYSMNYTLAYNAKKLSLKHVNGLVDCSFNRLLSYKDALLESNPGSVVLLESKEDSDQFRRIFICLRACVDGFGFCRPIVYFDGTFVTAKFKGCLLAASTKNGDNGLYPLAIAVVDSETTDNWHLFLNALASAIGTSRPLTFLSDRHKCLVSSIPEAFPNSYHSYCVWHLELNLRNAIRGDGQRRQDIVRKFWDLARAPTHRDFNVILKEIHDLGFDDAIAFIQSVSPRHWENAYFRGPRYNNLSSSLAECFNFWVKDQRGFPITAMLDEIRRHMMKKISEHLDTCSKWSDFLTPTYHDIFQRKENMCRACHMTKSNEYVYEVLAEESYLVDLSKFSCSCNIWFIEGFPCAHAIVAIKQAGIEVKDFIEPYFHTSSFRATYSFPIFLVVGYDKANTVPKDPEVLPPDMKRSKNWKTKEEKD